MAYAIKRTYQVDPPATVSTDMVRVFQDWVASSWSVHEVSVIGDITGDVLVGLQVDVVIEAPDSGTAGRLARQAIFVAIRSVGLRGRPFRVTAGSAREV